MNIAVRLVFIVSFGGLSLHAAKPEKGFEALAIFDYFKAKQIFTEISAKKPDAYSQYGLAVIYSRHDNPFYNMDSAAKYIYSSYQAFMAKQQARKFSSFFIDNATILILADSITGRHFRQVKKNNTITGFDTFLKSYYLASKKLINEAVYLRDELEFNQILQINKSDSTHEFMLLHPQSSFHSEAALLKDRQLYDESTVAGDAASYIAFLAHYPKNAMVNTAYENLFKIYRQNSDLAGLSSFVSYPNAPQNLEAWKLLFSLSVKSFSYAELKNFLADHPDFPLKNSILKELELNKLVLYAYQKGDFTGFIDASGKYAINPVYDAATDFYEGLAVVNKNDSVFFINKENTSVFDKVYADASVFKNGIAPVKLNNKWYFINRQGQSVSRLYDEINELSNAVYIVKLKNKYGALDQFGQVILEPKFDKLGDFKNDYAYYIEDGSYGFVSKAGTVHKAEFEWISDFDNEQIAVVRQNNKYGLINVFGRKILECRYEQVIPADSSVFIVVQNNSYGFFSPAGCFFTPIAYEYLKEKPAEYYTDGRLLKLLKRGEQGMADKNGHMEISFGSYDEINFEANGLMRVKRKNKYGYLNKELNVSIPFKYLQAQDFSDSLALVKLKDKYTMINTYGHEVFSTGAEVDKISSHYYTIDDGDVKHIINRKGAGILNDVISIQKVNAGLFIITLENGEIKLLSD